MILDHFISELLVKVFTFFSQTVITVQDALSTDVMPRRRFVKPLKAASAISKNYICQVRGLGGAGEELRVGEVTMSHRNVGGGGGNSGKRHVLPVWPDSLRCECSILRNISNLPIHWFIHGPIYRNFSEEVGRVMAKGLKAQNLLRLLSGWASLLCGLEGNSLGFFCAGQPLAFVEEKGCSESLCASLSFSATLGSNRTFRYGHHCCQTELCNQGDFQGEC